MLLYAVDLSKESCCYLLLGAPTIYLLDRRLLVDVTVVD
jgi:hypothetical protein